MTKKTERHGCGDTGSGPRGGRRRAHKWIVALVLVGLGAAGGAITTVAVDANAHGGWRHGATDPGQATERLQQASARVLDKVDATDEQIARIDEILASTVRDVFPLRAEHEEHRRDLLAELVRPQIDRAALERVRAAELALAETATAQVLDAVVAIAEVLEPEQRRELVERFLEHRH